ncbi:MAG: hypothetical protein HIU88_10460 [Acidobacteria bacterium]|nr:hypothetical protein [Acidobacteriota bacterium]
MSRWAVPTAIVTGTTARLSFIVELRGGEEAVHDAGDGRDRVTQRGFQLLEPHLAHVGRDDVCAFFDEPLDVEDHAPARVHHPQ